ncbi:MAG: hypothetical protein R3F28_03420 [Candidatus Kapaibacterium sp.]
MQRKELLPDGTEVSLIWSYCSGSLWNATPVSGRAGAHYSTTT